MSNTPRPDQALGTIIDAAEKWATELSQYVIPSAYETSTEDGQAYEAELETLEQAITQARARLGIPAGGADGEAPTTAPMP